MSFFKNEQTLAQAHMCQCGECNNIYYHTPLVSNRWGVRVECCSNKCYLRAIGFHSSQKDYKKTYKNHNPTIPTWKEFVSKYCKFIIEIIFPYVAVQAQLLLKKPMVLHLAFYKHSKV